MKFSEVKMKCNNCKTEMEDLYYNPDRYGYERLVVKRFNNETREYDKLGVMKFCPKCGNVRVNTNKI